MHETIDLNVPLALLPAMGMPSDVPPPAGPITQAKKCPPGYRLEDSINPKTGQPQWTCIPEKKPAKCPPGWFVDSQGECYPPPPPGQPRLACESNADCWTDQTCVGGACRDKPISPLPLPIPAPPSAGLRSVEPDGYATMSDVAPDYGPRTVIGGTVNERREVLPNMQARPFDLPGANATMIQTAGQRVGDAPGVFRRWSNFMQKLWGY